MERNDAVQHAIDVGFTCVRRPGRRPGAPTRRILAAIGWSGACNYQRDVVELSAVLRSWEDRFGALLVGISFCTLDLAAASPPVTEDECLRGAAEHIAFCCDAFETHTGQMSTDTLPRYAVRLRRLPRWRFWWD